MFLVVYYGFMDLTGEDVLREMVGNLMDRDSLSRSCVSEVKREVAGKYHLSRMPSNSEIIGVLREGERDKLLPFLRRKATRTISGVTVVAVMTEPYPCPQSEPCAYCPGGPSVGAPQSYTGFEPAAMRGSQSDFDPYLQVKNRIRQLRAIGHKVDKIELIVMGGTFPATPVEYQRWFIQRCLDAITDRKSESLEEAKKNAEKSSRRNIGITVETRPDWAKGGHVDRMLNMGVTRVEVGVQNPSDRIYRLVGRRHTVQDVIEATRILKDSGLKVVYHLMPGLPGSNPERDLEAFKEVFTNPVFKPDMIKIYPCLVMDGTETYRWYKKGKYEPYTHQTATDLLVEVKKIIPPWMRIMRIQRDIPAPLIVAGVKKSNLRQLVHRKMEEEGLRCRCIRCREVGHRMEKEDVEPDPEEVEMLTTQYQASGGEEIFISAEDLENDVLMGYLRLRIPSQEAHRPEVRGKRCSFIRELHVYGPLVPVGEHSAEAWQHKGYGNSLLEEAEHISQREYNMEKILVTSGLGAKQYYMRFGYQYEGPYMSKLLEDKI
ncbi:MAG: tRNA uridine(34) 5-carboxymethylaminomethyl modification radical SAM/GNAT enzyme Elp3 [Thermoproteota archaeon]